MEKKINLPSKNNVYLSKLSQRNNFFKKFTQI